MRWSVCFAMAANSCTQPPPPAPAATPAPEPAPASAAAERPVGRCALDKGQSTRTLDVEGVDRRYELLIGKDAGEQAPLVFAWHGFGSNPRRMIGVLAPERLWTDAIVIGPYGLGRTFEQFGDTPRDGWQVAKGELEDRDLKFFDALLHEAKTSMCIDETRVYSTGFSNGGFFSHVLGCHRSDALAAIAPTGGGGPFMDYCAGPLPVLITHGRADAIVPFDAAERSFAVWRRYNNCDPEATVPADGCAPAPGCKTPLEVCVFEGKHTWPMSTTETVATFLRAHAKPSRGKL